VKYSLTICRRLWYIVIYPKIWLKNPYWTRFRAGTIVSQDQEVLPLYGLVCFLSLLFFIHWNLIRSTFLVPFFLLVSSCHLHVRLISPLSLWLPAPLEIFCIELFVPDAVLLLVVGLMITVLSQELLGHLATGKILRIVIDVEVMVPTLAPASHSGLLIRVCV
jgi:hypothetical protein